MLYENMIKKRTSIFCVSSVVLFMLDLVCSAWFEQPVLCLTRSTYISVLWSPYSLSAKILSGFLTLLITSVHNRLLWEELVSLILLPLFVGGLKRLVQPSLSLYYIFTCLLVMGSSMVIDGVFVWTLHKIIANIIVTYGVIRYITR